jgi:hypothetical protein
VIAASWRHSPASVDIAMFLGIQGDKPIHHQDGPSSCGAAATLSTYGSELSVAVRHLGGDFGNEVPMLGNFAVVDTEEIEERRGLTT